MTACDGKRTGPEVRCDSVKADKRRCDNHGRGTEPYKSAISELFSLDPESFTCEPNPECPLPMLEQHAHEVRRVK